MLLQSFYRPTKDSIVVYSNFSPKKFPNIFLKCAVLLRKITLNKDSTMILKSYMDIYPLNNKCF